MEVSSFKIYNASAGSGKTYTLSKEYLKLLLSNGYPLKFRQILAITFTNKAVAEMKGRILQNLYDFGQLNTHENENGLFRDLCMELEIEPAQIQQRAKTVLKRILHNYSFFEISTIDKFNHKIIKTFARDLQLSQNFEVELDTEFLLQLAVGQLLERAGSDSELTEALVAFSLEKIEDDKSWDIGHDLVEIGKLLFQENHTEHINRLCSKSIPELKKIQNSILVQIKEVEKNAVESAQATLKEIERLGFVEEDFPRQTLPNHFKKIIDKQFDVRTLYNNKLEQNLIDNKILKASDGRDPSLLSQTILGAYSNIKKVLYQRAYLKNIYGNMVPLTVLNEIAKEVKNIELEKDIIPISAMNTLLSKEIKNQPVPFIYERLGEKYRHYFIDEFQDTSQMQWENLIPLIGNALEGEDEKREQGSLFLVGDVKQAIYRWRGGKAEQFLNLLNLNTHPFVVHPNVRTLDTNWRSYSEIVQFNNSFFTSIAPFLKNQDYQNLFLQSRQQNPVDKPGGFVQLSFLDHTREHLKEAHCSEVLQSIKEARSKNYAYADICVLVRKNADGMLLANFLSENNIPVVSSESLLLKNSSVVTFLVSVLKVIENEMDREAIFEILSHLAENKQNKHDFIRKHINNINELLHKDYGFDLQGMRSQSTLTILESAIIQFDLSQKASAHVTFLMDEVLEIEKRDGAGIHSFLKHWDSKKQSLSLTAPEAMNAVKIMTIHKAKGLEFPIVIFPFANAVIDDKRKKKKSWIPKTNAEDFLGLDEFLVNHNKDMLDYNAISASVYQDEVTKTELDALNVLYVALTRAEKGLYIISETTRNTPSLGDANSYSDLFQHFLIESKITEHTDGLYTFGELMEQDSNASNSAFTNINIPYITRQKHGKAFTISTKSSQLWDDEQRNAIQLGNLIHFALSLVKTTDDLPIVLEELKTQGHLKESEMENVSEILNSVISHPSLKKYYAHPYKILNEQEILIPEGKSIRPDRLVIFNNEVTIIDYKTGKPSPSHKEQILTYSDALKDMNFIIKDTIIVYIAAEIKPLFL
ncbi:UvrD-helicase domain-containing protein [Flagellimonas sp.]|uniref:UvrD-helicase domain-containing protein n=1 Tax=Flagellimonas sp. TaxID=2058762 RepID=UPI003B51209E